MQESDHLRGLLPQNGSNEVRWKAAGFAVFIVILAGVFADPSHLCAQQDEERQLEASISVQIGAEVISSIEMITLRNIQFGNVLPSEETIRIHPITDHNTGKMKILGQPNGTVRVSFQEYRSLQQIEGGNAVDFNYQLAGNSQDVQSTANLIDFNNFEAQLNEDGEYYIWIGGNAQVSNLQPGTYRGDFTLEIEYM